MFCASKFEWCGVEEVGSGSFSYVKKDTKSKCRMVVFFFIKIYKQVIFQQECIVSPVQSSSGKALHCAWHFHRRNSSVLSYEFCTIGRGEYVFNWSETYNIFTGVISYIFKSLRTLMAISIFYSATRMTIFLGMLE